MKIFFLDPATVDLGDVDLKNLRRLGDYHALKHCPRGKLPRKVRDAEVLITNKVRLDRENLSQFNKVKLICVAATGFNNIALEAARQMGIAVTNVAGYSTDTVVAHTFMFLLAFAHRLGEHHRAVLAGEWSRSPYFTLLDYPFEDLTGKTLGILGYGTIGKKVARIAKAFRMHVLVARLPGRRYPQGKGPQRVSLPTLLQKSDFISLHCSLSPATEGLIDTAALKRMKPSAFLLNLARGPVVVEEDIVRALEKKLISGYATDVTTREPLPRNHPFLRKSLAKKIWLTPHVAWASRESRQRLIDEIAKNIAAFQKGRRRNRLV